MLWLPRLSLNSGQLSRNFVNKLVLPGHSLEISSNVSILTMMIYPTKEMMIPGYYCKFPASDAFYNFSHIVDTGAIPFTRKLFIGAPEQFAFWIGTENIRCFGIHSGFRDNPIGVFHSYFLSVSKYSCMPLSNISFQSSKI